MSSEQSHYKSIRSKLNLMVVVVTLLSIVILGAVALFSMGHMRTQTLEINTRMGQHRHPQHKRCPLRDEPGDRRRWNRD